MKTGRSRLMVGLIQAVCLAAFLMIGVRASAEVTPTVDFLAQALLHQEQLCGHSLELTYKVVKQTPGNESTLIREIRYIRTADLIYMEDKPANSDVVEISSYSRIDNEARSLGKKLSDNSIVGAIISRVHVSERLTCLNLMETSALYVTMCPLYQAIQKGIVICQENIDGHLCWKVVIAGEKLGYPTNRTITVWVDPRIGGCPRRLDMAKDNSLNVPTTFSISFNDYKDIGNGVWFPSEQTFSHGGNSKTILRLESSSVGKAVGNLLVEFPPGTRVWDSNARESYIAGVVY